MHRHSTITGVEIDALTARIAKALYPDADIRAQGFENSQLADGFYDVAISNVPFGDYPVHDPGLNAYRFPIHDYFFAKALGKVRPGGLVMFITSRGTMDKVNSTLREYLAPKTELLGAVRLPNTAFKQNAGTEVTTDIVMLRKLHPGETPRGAAWRELRDFTNHNFLKIPINEYFVEHPHMMLGHLQLTGHMYRDNEITLEGDGRVLGDALGGAIPALPAGAYRAQRVEMAEPTAEQTIPVPDFVKPNAYCVHDGIVCIREENVLRPLTDLPSDTRSRIRGLIQVRDSVRLCLRSQLDGTSEEQVVEARRQLNYAYDRFVARFGPVNLRANQRAFDGDPDLPLLLSLEHYNDETKRATKATIFTERTIHHREPIESVGSPKEALLVSLNERGRVDLDHMAGLLNKPTEEFLPDLKGIVFLNPQTNEWETDDHYLSGNVREKLAVADAAAVTDPRFAENVEALKSVQPADLSATEIDVRLGASWLPPEDVKDFTNGLLSIPSGVEIGHIHALGTWHINGNWEARGATANTTDWGTDRYTALELIEDALNLKTPTVYDLNEDKKPVVNAQATEAAREKQERIKERFKEWVWSDDARRERLCRLYNDTFNHTRVRTFNGDHLTLPGASGAIQLHGHQKAGVWRILQTPNTLLAHVVGAGKTYTMVSAAMELKRLGLARKPLFAVPNHMLGQFSTELLTLYPGANILVAGKEDFESKNRKKLFSRIATGNWDAVIVTHSGFERIPLARETQERFFHEQLHELEMIKRQLADSSNRRLVKEIERAKKRLEARLQALAAEHKKDNTLTFEELGVDRLFVDEAHCFKNLFYVTKMTRIAGLPQTASERAFDMYLKVRHVQSLNGGGGVVFATGTPIANSMAEMFTMQRYLQADQLKKHNLHHFDSWAATFGEPITAMELSPDGAGYRLNTRFARFINVPELMQMFRQSADVQTAAMLNLPRPKLEGEKPAIRNSPATPDLKAFVQELAARADRLKTGRVDPSEDNMLKITSEGRKAALDLRLMKPATPDEPQGKVNLAVENIHRIWQATAAERSAQLVFCDLSTPKDKGFSVYRDMADKLERLGVPTRDIAFIQDYDSDASKLALFREVRAGKVRVLFGSTQKMGSGTNVQERLIALHHLDAPWRPADVEQREGRILRQGNKNAVVSVFRYVSEGSFDAYMWQSSVGGGPLAFPGSEGYGAYTKGGRGGKVFLVTNLNDSGPGSLREAIEAKGPRTVIFRVGGVIETKGLAVREPYLTIAGQTAPGDGICIKKTESSADAFSLSGTHDVIIRFLRFRAGNNTGQFRCDSFRVYDTENFIVDHCSCSWGNPETLSASGSVDRYTVQWCIASEGNNKQDHAFATALGGDRSTWHHNLFAHMRSRVPRWGDITVQCDFRNNVIYDWGSTCGYGDLRTLNYVNNYLRKGPSTSQRPPYFIVDPKVILPRSIYVDGNIMAGMADVDRDNWKGVLAERSLQSSAPFPAPQLQTQSAAEAFELVLRNAGATRPRRDSVDARIVSDVRNGTGKIIDDEREVGGWPAYASGEPPVDTARDGIPDEWKKAHGLPLNTPNVANALNADGYTNLEAYLNSLVVP